MQQRALLTVTTVDRDQRAGIEDECSHSRASESLGGVLTSDDNGFQPLLDSTPLPSPGAWAGTTGFHPFPAQSGPRR